MPLNPPRKQTKTDAVAATMTVIQRRSEAFLYRHAPVLAAFLAGIITGYAIGVW